MKSKQSSIFAVLCAFLLLFTSCGKEDTSKDKAVSGEKTTAANNEVAPGNDVTVAETGDITEKTAADTTDNDTTAPVTTAENTTTANTSSPLIWKQAYKEYLESVSGNSGFKFSVGEVFRGNGRIPELLVSMGDFHAAGIKILSFMNGKVEDLGDYGEYGCCDYDFEDGLICGYYNNMGYSSYNVYKQNATGFEELVAFTEDANGEKPVYSKNGETISKRQFLELLDEFYEIDFDDDFDDIFDDDDDYDDLYDNDIRTLEGKYKITDDNIQKQLMSIE
jgi:hypothetical protein